MRKAKKCSKCNKIKPLTEYYKAQKTLDNLQTHCKTCHKKMVKKWQIDHSEEYWAYQDNYEQTEQRKQRRLDRYHSVYKHDPDYVERCKGYCKAYYQKNRAKILAQAKARHQAKKEGI